jgi:hypothetical protein
MCVSSTATLMPTMRQVVASTPALPLSLAALMAAATAAVTPAVRLLMAAAVEARSACWGPMMEATQAPSLEDTSLKSSF